MKFSALAGLCLVAQSCYVYAAPNGNNVPMPKGMKERAPEMEKRAARTKVLPGRTKTMPPTAVTTTRPPTTTVAPTTTTMPTTTTTPAPVCDPTWRGPVTISGTGTLPKPTSFVQLDKNSRQLTLDGRPYKAVGPNIYWLCLDENVGPIQPPSKARVREALAMAVAMGANTVRLHTCGISVGTPYSIEPTLNNFNGYYDAHDYAIYAAQQYGLRVILPLTDQHNYYHGGIYTFLGWLGLPQTPMTFYTNADAITAYSRYINYVLQHVNAYNGIRNGDNPTIMAWETVNEGGAYLGGQGYPPQSWTQAITDVIKLYSRQQLIIDGTAGIAYGGQVAGGLNVANVDLMSDHAYPRNLNLANAQRPYAYNAGKGFLYGEYDWTNCCGGDSVSTFLNGISSYTVGNIMWSLFGHDDQCCKYVKHNDGYSLYYPYANGDGGLSANANAMMQNWYALSGRQWPGSAPTVACPQPVF